MPDCECGECPLGEIAADPEVNEQARRWMEWRGVFDMSGDQESFRRMCLELGLYDDVETLFRLEDIWRRFKKKSTGTQ